MHYIIILYILISRIERKYNMNVINYLNTNALKVKNNYTTLV